MKDKKKKTPPKKHELIVAPPYTEGHWEDEFENWEDFQPSGNMGKWWKQIKLDKLKSKLKRRK
jgi:hypothetical protein